MLYKLKKTCWGIFLVLNNLFHQIGFLKNVTNTHPSWTELNLAMRHNVFIQLKVVIFRGDGKKWNCDLRLLNPPFKYIVPYQPPLWIPNWKIISAFRVPDVLSGAVFPNSHFWVTFCLIVTKLLIFAQNRPKPLHTPSGRTRKRVRGCWQTWSWLIPAYPPGKSRFFDEKIKRIFFWTFFFEKNIFFHK